MNLKHAALYFLYTILAFCIFAWIAFPSQKAATILSNKLNNFSDNIEVTISEISPGIFLGCKMYQTDIVIDSKIKLNFGFIKIAPSAFSVFSDKKKGNIIFSEIVLKMNDVAILKTMGMSELNFNSIDFGFIKSKQKVEIINFDAKGAQCDVKVNGNIYFFNKLNELGKTKLDLQVNILPKPSYLSKFAGISSVASSFDDSKQGDIKLHISGTLENPKITL